MPASRASGAAHALVATFAGLALCAGGCRRPPVAAPAGPAAGRPRRLVPIDTLRADRVGAYGSTRGLTPALDRFAATAARFDAALTQAPLTLPAHATMLTGLHPARHGVRTNDGFRLDAKVPTLAEALKKQGYATGAFIGGYPLQAASGLSRGFDRYDDDFLKAAGAVERSADAVVAAALGWIEPRAAAPFFAWLHLFDPHSPYTPPAPFAAAHAGAPYDGEVAYTDAALGRFLDRLRQIDVLSRASVVVVADHGESLGEHGERTHGTFLYDATVRVPLVVKLPDRSAPTAVETPVETTDLAPTIAALAGAAIAGDGVNLMPLMVSGAGDPERAAYAESYYQNVLLGWSPLRAVRTARWKFIEAPRPELYDLTDDPGELHNRIDERVALAAGLRGALPPRDAARAAGPTAAARDASERLRSLGYVSGSTAPAPDARAIDPKDRVEVWAAIEDGIDSVDRNPAAARGAFARALRLDPVNGLAMKYLADISFRSGALAEARAGYRRAEAAGFRHPDVFVNLAAIAEREGRPDEARAALADAVRLSPGDADAWNRLGLLEAGRGAVPAARDAFAKAIDAAPDRAEPRYNLAVVERRAGNEAAAMQHLRDALARNPSYPEALYELGTGHLRDRQPERAIEAYRAALAARPGYAEALFGAARAALDLGRVDEARRDYEQFIRTAPPAYRQQVAAAREALRRIDQRR